MASNTAQDAFLLFVGFFVPPVAAFLKSGCNHEFWISLLLTIIGWLPGVAYTWYIILRPSTRGRYHVPPLFGQPPAQAQAYPPPAQAQPQTYQPPAQAQTYQPRVQHQAPTTDAPTAVQSPTMTDVEAQRY